MSTSDSEETPEVEKPKRRRSRKKAASEDAPVSDSPRQESEAAAESETTRGEADPDVSSETEVASEMAAEDAEPDGVVAEAEPAEEPEPEPELEPAAPAAAPGRRRRGQRGERRDVVVRAQAKYVRSSARKARLVCDHIRGKSVEEARAILAHTSRAVARDWSKLLESAVANAENNHELVGEDLYIKAVHADEGPTIRRFRPRAMGRATRIRKRTSHLTILLTPKD
jgi:ribosomal protein L22